MKVDEKKKELRRARLPLLQKKLNDRKKAYLLAQMKEESREKKNPAKLKNFKKEIAIISTIIREKIEKSQLEASKPEAQKNN